ncbi:hypothetical protein MMIC_P0605 [Mariprofundus micogutta]|uniref:STAS/SEC14 domain-containing protein n=1 Tax=Mariprofundus micogutta TaxID=1921010 RepID=A0A1L8CL89_9PROT|nr:hypothetical protein [Mariprofundus micogutta]GAV19655.1 hypothetical protein MMIC_P0605 [Mariprofundus micogutta]
MAHSSIWETDGLYRKFSGDISGYEILQSNIELQGDARFKNIEYVINDFTDVTSHSVEVVHTEAYASTDQIVSHTKHRLKIALVVPQVEMLALAENYCELMKGQLFECDIFRSLEQARSWLER